MNERIREEAVEEQIRGEIMHGAFSHPYFRAILDKFGKVAFGRASACMEFQDFVSRIVQMQPRRLSTCLEIGTFHGITAVLLSQHFDRVISVSVDERPEKLLKHRICAHLGITNIEFHDAKDNEEKARIVRGVDFDFAYSDGDHTNDTLLDFNLVQRCGRVLFHEYWPLQAPVWNLVNSLPREEVIRARYDCFAYWERGLQRPEPMPGLIEERDRG